MKNINLAEAINKIKKEKNAVILAHNYQLSEVQAIADFTGDSLGLSRQAEKTDAEIIVFCGVHFMAETASIISPEKKVLIPVDKLTCTLADSITAEELRQWKQANEGAVVVSYINTNADVKAETDYCITSANAVRIVQSIPEDKKILFLPDKYLGNYCQAVTGRKNMEIWDGCCCVHAQLTEKSIKQAMLKHPGIPLLLHPESPAAAWAILNNIPDIYIKSTEGMINYVAGSEDKEFIVGTETGILYRLEQQFPEKNFYSVSRTTECRSMKRINLENILECLEQEKIEVKVPDYIREKAMLSIDRMMSIN